MLVNSSKDLQDSTPERSITTRPQGYIIKSHQLEDHPEEASMHLQHEQGKYFIFTYQVSIFINQFG